MSQQKPENPKRRGFLLAAGAGSAGAVAAVTIGMSKTPVEPKVVSAEDKVGGYEETRHISNYYRTARI